ncbi:MAG: hypothetical protein ACSLE9_10520 [Burkholderiaceae bacterium]
MNPNQPAAIGGLSPDAFSSLFQSINGLRNRRALAALLGCMVVGILVAGLFSLMATRLGFFVAFLGGLFLFVAAATGIHAAGVLLMDQARGAPLRSLPDAVVYGLLCIPKFIVLVLALALVAIAVFIVLAIVYFICKIPVLGPILFVVVFPLSVVISGLTLCGLFLCMFLALPAIWEGATITRAIAQALAIARSRLVESILLLAVVGLLSGVIGVIVFSVLFTGLMPSIGLSASILGGDGLYSLMGMMRRGGGDFGEMGGGGAGSAGYAIAAGIGAGLLWALAGSLLSLVYLLGLNLVYLRVTEGLDVGATEAALKARLDDAKRQAADLGQKARDAAERARDQARQSAAAAQASAAAAAAAAVSRPATPVEPAAPPTTASPPDLPPGPAAPAAATAPTCPQCLATVGKDDLFCGICGFRLK